MSKRRQAKIIQLGKTHKPKTNRWEIDLNYLVTGKKQRTHYLRLEFSGRDGVWLIEFLKSIRDELGD